MNIITKNLKKIKDLSRLKNKDYLIKNTELKNKYKGKRCFIIGNGPSTNEMDLSYLKDEITYGVNLIYKSKHIDNINPTFFSHIEPLKSLKAFNQDSIYYPNNLYGEFKKDIIDKYNPICFFNYQYIDFLKNKYNSLENIYFLEGLRSINESYEIHNKLFGDITKPNSFMDGVVFSAVCNCIYMGFSDIYILGCDSNHIMNGYQAHCYNDTNEDITHSSRSNRLLALNLFSHLTKWEIIKNYADQQLVSIRNAGINSMVDVFPKVDFQSLFKKDNNEEC